MTDIAHDADLVLSIDDEGATGGRGPATASAVTAEALLVRRNVWSRHEQVLLPVATLVLIVAVWEAFGRAGRIDPLFFSYPSEIAEAFADLVSSGRLVKDLRVSGLEFLWGFSLSLLCIPLGVLLGFFKRVRYAVDPIITALYATPMIALMPMFVIWFGLGMQSKVAIIVLMASFPMIINSMEGVRTVDPDLVRAARSFRASKLQLIWSVIVPSSLPFIVTGVRLAIGRALIALVIGEFIGSIAGIGWRIRQAADLFRTAEYLAVTIVLMVISVALTALLRTLERRLAPWREGRR